MKKILYSIIIFFAFLGLTNAEKCTVVTGSGKNIGDEIACGTEHFYVTSNDGENVKMLAKYNLLVESDMYVVSLNDFSSSDYKGYYQNKEVQKLLSEGYYYNWLGDFIEYDYDENTKEYYNYEITLFRNYYGDSKSIFFDKEKTTEKEVYEDEEIKEYLSNDYGLVENYIVNGKYIGARLYKYLGEEYEYKTIYLDGQFISYFDLHNKKEIKALLENGYYISSYNYTTCNNNSNITSCDFYTIEFRKDKNYDYINIFADKEYTNGNDLTEYLKSNTDFQKYVDNGYGYYFYYANHNYIGLKLYKKISEELSYPKEIVQDKSAIGSHGAKESPIWPARGIYEISFYEDFYYYDMYYSEENIYNDGFFDVTFDDDSYALFYLNTYKQKLNKKGYNISGIDLISVKELNHIIKEITGNELPLNEYYQQLGRDNNDIVTLDNIKDNMSSELQEKYSWIWGTTYWTKTISLINDNKFMYYVDTLGELCSAGNYCPAPVPAGLRPLVTISANDLEYQVETQTDGHGQITPSKKTADDGEEITFTITPDKGYVLKEIKVTDADGNTVTFTENKFTMPSSNVLIEATFIIENPETTTINIILSIIMFAISFGIIIKFKKNADWLNT